ncbi:fatty acyl-AMP ligase [Streptomyces sp. BK205]|uniref:fatty acyl-AMP ligase n=1 Tax=Streptomyces sp. BK205 TaxID=2512164 RepID=UPI0010459034|nr:fatty acyl-AMP ligase [Streptomyces sp. BK205]TCR16055.1 acyl-CoA synthetase (AMP-forming)/AMP-acid ligase II [Streptomyces sp. BK205]
MSAPGKTLADLWQARADGADSGGYGFVTERVETVRRLPMTAVHERARALAAQLDAPPGARAVLVYPPSPDFVTALAATTLAGLVAVPVYPPGPGGPAAAAAARLRHVIDDCKPELVLTVAELMSLKQAGPQRWIATDTATMDDGRRWRAPRVLDDDVAVIQYTSGSTGTPKGVVLRHRSIVADLAAIRETMALSADSVIVGWVPPYHDMGLIGQILAPLYTGCWSYLMSPLGFLRRPALWLESISLLRGTVAGGPNFGYDLCLQRVTEAERSGLDLSSWRVAFSGAERIRPGVLRRFHDTFRSQGFAAEALYGCYGLAEASLLVSGGRPGAGVRSIWVDRESLEQGRISVTGEQAAGAVEIAGCGSPAVGQDVRIVDPVSALTLDDGQVGEVWVRGPIVASGYWHRPNESAETFQARLADGTGPFLRTGDLGFLLDDELYLTGRSKDLVIIGGRNLYPTDLEEAAQQADPRLRPGCGVAVQVPSDDEDRLVLIQETAERDQEQLAALGTALRRSVADRLDVVVDTVVLTAQRTLPKTTSGKLRRSAAARAYAAGHLDVRYEWNRPVTRKA